MSEQERINKNVNELSQKLLEGCKLLSESCPETNVPLVSTKDGRMYSVGNGAYYIRDGGELHKVNPDPVGTPTTAEHKGDPAALPAASAPFGAPAGASPWTGAPALPSPPGREAETTDSQSLSARVAQKLLEGYTLLSESCPQTNVPLVQNTSGQIHSVGTGKYYTRVGTELREAAPPEATAGSMAPPPPPSMHAQPSPSSLGLAASFASAAGEHVVPPSLSFGPPPAAPKPLANGDAPNSPAPWHAPMAMPATDAAGGAHENSLPGTSHPIVESTLGVLYQKLDQARLELLKINTSEAAAPLVHLVKETAEAIAALKKL